jgi:two-component system NarL family sensor kinase
MSLLRNILIFILISVTTAGPASSRDSLPPEKTEKTEITNNSVKKEQLQLIKTDNKKIVSLIIILVILLMMLSYFYYRNGELKRKNKQKDIKQKIQLNIINSGIDGQENERKKIAAFLHDNINSLLSSVGLHLNAFSTQHNIQSEEITKAKAILEEAHDRLRDMSHELIPALLVRFGLLFALEDLCEKNTNQNIQFQFLSSVPSEKRYAEKFEMKIYFIVSELLNNIIKHSGASKALISLRENENWFILIIQDNGKGFNAGKQNEIEGFGLNRIRARIKKLKGSMTIVSKANENNGTTVKIKVPIS